MKHPFNCMGLLALPALAALLFLPTRDPAFLGFLGFLVFLPLLLGQSGRAVPPHAPPGGHRRLCGGMHPAGPLLLFFHFLSPDRSPMPQALGLSFGLSLILFCLYHSWLEWKGGTRGAYEPDHKASGVPGPGQAEPGGTGPEGGGPAGDHRKFGKREVQSLPQAGYGHRQRVRLYCGGAVSIPLTGRQSEPAPHTNRAGRLHQQTPGSFSCL